MTPARAVFFDLDGTLLDDEASYHRSVASAFAALGPRLKGIDLVELHQQHHELGKTYWQRNIARGTEDLRSIRFKQWTEAFEACGILDEDLVWAVVDAYGEARSSTVVVFPEVEQVLTSIREDGHCLVLITNGPGPEQRRKLWLGGLDGYFDSVLAAGDLQYGKPDARIFQDALDCAGCDPAVTWHVGDHLMADVGGAVDFGLRAAWLNRGGLVREPQQPKPHAEIASLSELLPLL